MQFIFNFKPDCQLQAKLLELILGHALKAEQMSPGSFDVMIERLLVILSNNSIRIQPLNFKNISRVVSRRPCSVDLETYVFSKIIDERISSIVKESLELAGFGGRIIIEKSTCAKTSIELNSGYTFDVRPAWPMTMCLNKPRAFVIDGYIERVSEVHNLLEAASDAKEPVALFVRGMSDDVLNTIRVNFNRGTLQLVPINVKFDIEGINTVNDIAIVTGCDMVCSNKGDLISMIKYDKAPRLERIIIYQDKVNIQHNDTRAMVQAHVANLVSRRNVSDIIDDKAKLYDKRIKALSPNHVIIRIPDDKDYVMTVQQIDRALRTVRAIVDYGISDLNEIALTQFASELYVSKCIDTLTSLGALLT
jgi:chaperonin GroEL (HSP60 family)